MGIPVTRQNGNGTAHSPEKTGSTGRFTPGPDPKRGSGKKGRSGRPTTALRLRMDACRSVAVDQTHADLLKGQVEVKDRIRLVKDWAPPEEQTGGTTLTIRWANE